MHAEGKLDMTATLTLEDIVQKTSDLPSMPTAVLAVMREADSPTGSSQSVGRHLAQDQALSARVLRLANSAYYGLQRQVMDVPEAVVVLGMRCVRNLCVVASTYPWMSRPLSGYALGPQEMWTHSFAVAVGAQLAAERSQKVSSDAAFTAGLLHDIGKVAMSIWLENKLQAMHTLASRAGMSFDSIERKVLCYDHAEVGAHLGEKWNLPKPLLTAIHYHHQPNNAPESSPLADCVHVGDFLAMSMGYGLGGDGLSYDFQGETMERLGLIVDGLDDLAVAFVASYERHEQMFTQNAA